MEYEIIVDEEVKDYKAFARRPYYRMRGKQATEEQAFDIIRRVITPVNMAGFMWMAQSVVTESRKNIRISMN